MTEFIQQALIFFAAALVLVPLFQKLGFGSVLGYLIAGILIGPSGFGLMGETHTIAHTAELGVVFLLFMIGLELQPSKLWSMRRHLLGLGGAQIAGCTLAFALVGMALGLAPVAALVVGFSFSLSSTAFVVQTLTERNQFNTEFGRASFAILLMQDLCAIPALAIIPALSGNEAGLTWVGLVRAIAVLAALVVASRFAMRPMFRMVAATRSREIFMASTLFLVLGVAELTLLVGLSAALGAFVAGVLLADSEYRHELEINLEPFKSLLMGLFFIAVGMGVQLIVIRDKFTQIILLTIGYLIAKSLISYLAARSFKLGHQNSKYMALGIAQGGEFAFVIFGMVAAQQLASAETVALLTAVVTLSMALNPVLNLVGNRLARLRRVPKNETFDEIKDETPDVIIAGFGRFGQIFGRVLRAQNIPFVPIDHDPGQIESVRRFGNKVYYGDASRKDMLESAGAATAKIIVIAIDDVEKNLETARMVKAEFPHLKIFARARNRGHAYDLMAIGVHALKREVLDSSINMTGDVLIELGIRRELAALIVQRFQEHDEIMLQEQFKVRRDAKGLISVSQQGAQQLAEVLSQDALRSHIKGNRPTPSFILPDDENRVSK